MVAISATQAAVAAVATFLKKNLMADSPSAFCTYMLLINVYIMALIKGNKSKIKVNHAPCINTSQPFGPRMHLIFSI
jgi:hypothetical protein